MISVVVYGRNDSYGYNLHKRAAISFNCIAEVLTHPDDEIVFVDYNTPDDMPSFVEAIQDTLTDRAVRLLRVLRVRPGQHQRFKSRTHLAAVEPIARNVAIRRANPANSWILSTNTDMVFVPRARESSLSDIVADLPPGFYQLPRFELPETLWEGLDRGKPLQSIEAVRHWGRAMHLNEVVYLDPAIGYDAPGDFQLMRREDIFAINGFNEDMLLGWHVDSNLCKRMGLQHRRVGSLLDRLYGYHCDHTKVATAPHGAGRTENDMIEFVAHVTDSTLPAQADGWGMADEDIEEIHLSEGHAAGPAAVRAIEDMLGPMAPEFYESSNVRANYNLVTYKAAHVFPYLLNQFVSYPRATNLGYAGLNHRTLEFLLEAWTALGFTGRVLIAKETVASALLAGNTRLASRLGSENVTFVDRDTIADRSEILLFDFGFEDDPAINTALRDDRGPMAKTELLPILFKAAPAVFLRAVEIERHRLADGTAAPRKFIAVNAINTIFETLAEDCLWITVTPFNTRIRHGFVKPDPFDELVRGAAHDERATARRRKTILDGFLKRPTPIALLSYRDASGLLTPAERDQARTVAERAKDTAQGRMKKICLATLFGESTRHFADYVAYRTGEADRLDRNLSLLAEACRFGGVREWNPDQAEAIEAGAGAYLDDAETPANQRRHQRVLKSLHTICEVGADHGRGLPSVERRLLVEHERMLGDVDRLDADEVRYSFDFLLPALSRRATDLTGQVEIRDRLIRPTAAALRRVTPPTAESAASARRSEGPIRLGYLVDAAWLNAIDDRSRMLQSLLRSHADAPSRRFDTRVYAIDGCDPGFLTRARSWGIDVFDVAAMAGRLTAPGVLRQRLDEDRLDILVQESRSGLALALAETRVAPLQVFLALDATLWEPEGIDVLASPEVLRGNALDQAATKEVLWFEPKNAETFLDRVVPEQTLPRTRDRAVAVNGPRSVSVA